MEVGHASLKIDLQLGNTSTGKQAALIISSLSGETVLSVFLLDAIVLVEFRAQLVGVLLRLQRVASNCLSTTAIQRQSPLKALITGACTELEVLEQRLDCVRADNADVQLLAHLLLLELELLDTLLLLDLLVEVRQLLLRHILSARVGCSDARITLVGNTQVLALLQPLVEELILLLKLRLIELILLQLISLLLRQCTTARARAHILSCFRILGLLG